MLSICPGAFRQFQVVASSAVLSPADGGQFHRKLTHAPHPLRDDQWKLIKNGLPGRAGCAGVMVAAGPLTR